MPRIRCHYVNCVFLDDGYCGAATVEIDPDEGCMTYTQASAIVDDDEWEDEEKLLAEEWDEFDIDEEDDDLWLDDDDGF